MCEAEDARLRRQLMAQDSKMRVRLGWKYYGREFSILKSVRFRRLAISFNRKKTPENGYQNWTVLDSWRLLFQRTEPQIWLKTLHWSWQKLQLCLRTFLQLWYQGLEDVRPPTMLGHNSFRALNPAHIPHNLMEIYLDWIVCKAASFACYFTV